jgi:hypothetical protein
MCHAGKAHESSGSATKLAIAPNQTMCRAAAEHRLMHSTATPAAANTRTLLSAESNRIGARPCISAGQRSKAKLGLTLSSPFAWPD